MKFSKITCTAKSDQISFRTVKRGHVKMLRWYSEENLQDETLERLLQYGTLVRNRSNSFLHK